MRLFILRLNVLHVLLFWMFQCRVIGMPRMVRPIHIMTVVNIWRMVSALLFLMAILAHGIQRVE
ncbi:hypothetical protein DRE43_28505 [Salmonella enterica subsp. enterica serovar Java]|nr:hypothetical protein [Salmonella enterica subsp. enterica serovar Java]